MARLFPRLSLSLTAREVTSPKGAGRVLVAVPTGARRYDRDRLTKLRMEVASARLDEPLIAEVRALGAPGSVFLVSAGGGDGERSWSIDAALDATDGAALAKLLLRVQLPTYRALVRAGVTALVHADLDPVTCAAMRDGSRLLLRELRMLSQADGSLADDRADAARRVDTWIVQHLLYVFTQPVEQVLGETLPDLVPLVEQRRSSLSSLLAETG